MRYQVTTPLTPREALEQALADFGPSGLGLQLTSQTNLSLVFQGGGGHIAVTAEPGTPSTLEIETREWDYGVQQFMARVQLPCPWWRAKRSRPSRSASFTVLKNSLTSPWRPIAISRATWARSRTHRAEENGTQHVSLRAYQA